MPNSGNTENSHFRTPCVVIPLRELRDIISILKNGSLAQMNQAIKDLEEMAEV